MAKTGDISSSLSYPNCYGLPNATARASNDGHFTLQIE